ncbi:DNA-3-methyladenine glycosylase [Bacillus sp. es.034]|uniref:DNA-3-methyladenine glycosylase family protein n=1 Tax=Bacillus sp. es.034 TaxID=1761763 RepID=UPI000BFA390C|nr:DNA-3-methyladenine glycosylase [Bacillus sp. es.034]PFG03532.1 DNA-3-methyladenine glycosylase II [Bacillus sp. es.034]
MVVEKEGTLIPKAPYDFDKTLTFLRKFPPSKEEQAHHTFTKAIMIQEQVILFELLSEGDIETPQLHYRLYSDASMTDEREAEAIERISFYLSLYDDLIPFYHLSKTDPTFYPIAQKLYGYHHVKFLTPFENTCWAILSQRTPVHFARCIKNEFASAFGKSIQRNDSNYTAFPKPQQILNAPEKELLKVVRSERKVNYIMSAAKQFAEVSNSFLMEEDYETVNQWLKEINGIGDWSASFNMLRGIGRMERLPIGEKMLQKEIQSLYGEAADVSKVSDFYGGHVGYWAHYLRAAKLFEI